MRQRGFTLIEILVAVMIIGILLVSVMLSSTLAWGDRELENERDRILAISDHLRDQAALQNREYGLRIFEGGYGFLAWSPRDGLWLTDEQDELLRERKLPKGLTMKLRIEGRPVVLPEAAVDADQLKPQILLYSSGDLNSFDLEIRREDGAGVRIMPEAASDTILATMLEPER